jgi:fumarate hydratase class II
MFYERIMGKFRIERDSFGEVKVPSERLWGAQTQRSLEHFSIGYDLMPKEMIPAYAIQKKASALVNRKQGRLSQQKADMIVRVCNEILEGKLDGHFPLRVWMTGSGTQLNMNVNEVIANRCSQIAKKPLGSKTPVHPNDDVNMSQSSNDSFPTVMNMAAAMGIKISLIPVIEQLRDSLQTKAKQWKGIVKLGRTHLQDATPLTLGQEFSGYVAMLDGNLENLKDSLKGLYELTLGGTAVGTGLNTIEGFDRDVAKEIARLTKLPFVTAKNKFAAQGAHNALVQMSSSLKTLAVSLYKIASDIRLLSCGPRAGFYELIIPSNEPGSSIMPGKTNPTQCEALLMISIQVMANDTAVSFGGAGGDLEMNVYKPLIIYNIMHSIRILRDSCENFDKFLVRGTQPNLKRIKRDLDNSLMLVTALAPVIGYDKAARIAKCALDHDLSLKEAALKMGYVTSAEFSKLVNPLKMCYPSKKNKR